DSDKQQIGENEKHPQRSAGQNFQKRHYRSTSMIFMGNFSNSHDSSHRYHKNTSTNTVSIIAKRL
ncbi:MAG: hypothetical protein LBB21_01180, partial [Holosporaceae bacterium]|nr:hypothetical protein [Holosporaceae bacterium]